jgi:elongation factor Tu
VAALDEHVPDPERDVGSPFLMTVEGVHSIPGRGTVVTGRVARGVVRTGDSLEIVGLAGADGEARRVVVSDIESFHEEREAASAGESVGLLLRGLKRDEVVRGQVMAAPGSVAARGRGEAELFVLTAKDGGRAKPFVGGYRPQFYFGGTSVTGTLTVADGIAIQPGDHAQVGFDLQYPVGLEPGMRFALREGGRTIGAGVVTAVQG